LRASSRPILAGYDPRTSDRAPVRLGVILARVTTLEADPPTAPARPASEPWLEALMAQEPGAAARG
jgi:hypothetical protein